VFHRFRDLSKCPPVSDFQSLVDRRFNNGVPMDSFTETTREALFQQSIGGEMFRFVFD
jgi:hypothetical protein